MIYTKVIIINTIYISTTKNYGKDPSTTPMVKPQLPSLLAMIGYPINLVPINSCMQNCFSEFKKVITLKLKI